MERSNDTINVLGASPYNNQAITFANTFPGNNIKTGSVGDSDTLSLSDNNFILPEYSIMPALVVYTPQGVPRIWTIPKVSTDEPIRHYDSLIPVFNPNARDLSGFISWMEIAQCPKSEIIPEITDPPINPPETPETPTEGSK